MATETSPSDLTDIRIRLTGIEDRLSPKDTDMWIGMFLILYSAVLYLLGGRRR